MKTDDLVSLLVQDTAVAWRFDRALVLALFCGILFTAAVFFCFIHPRPDVAQAAGTVRFLFKFLVTLTLAMAAVGLLSRVAQPGAPVGVWRWAPIVAPTLLVVAVLAELCVMPQSTWAGRWIGSNISQCMTLIPLLAVMPLICLLFALRQGAPKHPGFAGGLAGLVSSAIAATFYASHCNDDSPFFVITWYPLASALVVCVGYLAGSRFLRW